MPEITLAGCGRAYRGFDLMKVVAFVHRGLSALESAARQLPDLHFCPITEPAKLALEIATTDAAVLSVSFYTSEVARIVRDHAPRLRWIQTASAGYDAFVRHGVPDSVVVTNAANVWGPTVAEHAMSLLLALVRRLPEAERNRAARAYRREEMSDAVGSLEQSTVLVVGYGSIGREVVRRARAFGMRTIVSTRSGKSLEDVDETIVIEHLAEALPRADAVILCLPLTPATRHLIAARELSLMKPSSIIVNVSRGEIVDQQALAAALRSGQIRAAGLDVFEPEPLPPDDPLWALSNVILTPHVAGYAPASFERLARLFADNVQRLRSNRPLINKVMPADIGYTSKLDRR